MTPLAILFVCVSIALNVASMILLWCCLKGSSDADDRFDDYWHFGLLDLKNERD